MWRKFKERISIFIAKNPARAILFGILFLNVVLLIIAALLISKLSPDTLKNAGFFESIFYTISMILDAGCIQYVVADIGEVSVALIIVCLLTIFIGMITFTGAIIGYVTNYISEFIKNTNAGNKKLIVSNHMVILNWNTRASEIINDLLYLDSKQKAVVLVNSRKDEIEKEINERLADTVSRENEELLKQCSDMPFIKRIFYIRKHAFKCNVVVIVRQGDVFSSKQLHDISLEHAKMVVILGNDVNNNICKFGKTEKADEITRGNSQTIKTLMQVADITSAEYSDDNQKIIVEISDEWTADLVDKIIKSKQVDAKCNIVPLYVNRVLGQLLSQFSLMPELNLVYKELFSNKGAAFYSEKLPRVEDVKWIREYLKTHKHALPLTFMDAKDGSHFYYTANSPKDIKKSSNVSNTDYTVSLNKNYWIERKNVIILGHNSKCIDIMRGFSAFRSEWGYKDSDEEILRIVVIDDKKHLEQMNHYEDYPFVIETVEADIYDKELILDTINRFVSSNETDTSILILSDDSALNEDIDSNALANLIYVQDIINQKVRENPDFDVEGIDVIVEIIDPKHHDIVNSYSVNNVVISNRYISKMITQIGEKEAIYDFYCDILTYDTDDSDGYDSKEIYLKKVSNLFDEIPKKCHADEFVRAVFDASADDSLPKEKQNLTVPLGYVKPGGKMVLFSGDQSQITVDVDEHDKLIVFSNH